MTNVIKFHLVQDFPDTLVLPPLAAKKLIPDWFKKIPPNNENDLTVKKCVPFIDAMGAGYTLLSHIDIIIFQTEEKEVRIWHSDEDMKKLHSDGKIEIGGHKVLYKVKENLNESAKRMQRIAGIIK